MGEICAPFLTICAVLGLTAALTIDSQLAIIKNDCYERLAIGQRLNARDIYDMHKINTVPDCKQVCTKEGDKCKSFSFGISAEGNGTCDLSMNIIRETIDLKPIGTVADTDYDLYIKKLGCKLVIEQTKPPQPSSSTTVANTIGYNTVEYTNPSSSITSTFNPVYEVSSTPLYNNKPTYGGEEIHQVQTLISIRPSIGLQPVIDLNRPEQGSYDNTRPPSNFEPDVFQPQLNYNTRPDHYDDSRPDFSFRPEYYSPDRFDYNPYSYARPLSSHEKPIGYETRPTFHNERPYNSRPSVSYGDSAFLYNRPFVDDNRPLGYEGYQTYRPQRPIMDDNLKPVRPNNGYNTKPMLEDDGYNSRPSLRPIDEHNGYNMRLMMEGDGYNSRYPIRPIIEYNRVKNGFYQTDLLDNPDRSDYSQSNLRPQSNSGYGTSYGSQYGNYQPSKQTEIMSDYDRPPRPINRKPFEDDMHDYKRPNFYPSFDRPVYDARPHERDLPPFRPSSLNHPYNENHYFRPAPLDYDPGPIRGPFVSPKPSYGVLMTTPIGPDDSGYRGNSVEPNRGSSSKGNGRGAAGKPVVSYNLGKNGERIMGTITEIDFDNSKYRKEIVVEKKFFERFNV